MVDKKANSRGRSNIDRNNIDFGNDRAGGMVVNDALRLGDRQIVGTLDKDILPRFLKGIRLACIFLAAEKIAAAWEKAGWRKRKQRVITGIHDCPLLNPR